MTDKLKELVADIRELIEGYVDIKDGENGPLPNNAMRATQLLDELSALLAEQAPAGESSRKGLLELREPDEMIAWLNDLNSNWAVCRNTRSFKEGQPSEYWKKFDKAMGAAFELQIALMKLAAGQSSHPAEPRDPAAR